MNIMKSQQKKKKTFTNLSSRFEKNSLQLVQNSMANRFSHLRSESNSMGEERGSSSLCIWQRKREIERERERFRLREERVEAREGEENPNISHMAHTYLIFSLPDLLFHKLESIRLAHCVEL